MIDGCTIVLDVGKTNAKVTLWNEHGQLSGEWTRANAPSAGPDYRALDVDGIAAWLTGVLAACARRGRVRRIVPVAHGAAAAIVKDGRLLVPPMDYEHAVNAPLRAAYAAERDAFAATGSPFLPLALNLGLQLHVVESLHGPLPADARILPWPQYWAWHLCGVMAAEVTSLGCHSDLWRPRERRYSDLAFRRGWAARMPGLEHARETLGTLRPALSDATGLPLDCEVLCGLHDSNAALLALRGHAELAERDATVLSTGTWFVAMRSLAPGTDALSLVLDERRDCLLNVDVHGRPVPSARFMGGREAELIRGAQGAYVREFQATAELLARAAELVAQGARVYPSFVAGVGPYSDAVGSLRLDVREPREPSDRGIMASLYLALMSDTVLELVGARDAVLVEGPFADDELFLYALAALRPQRVVYTCDARHDLAYGALRLVAPRLAPPSRIARVEPRKLILDALAADWRRHAGAPGVTTNSPMSAKR